MKRLIVQNKDYYYISKPYKEVVLRELLDTTFKEQKPVGIETECSGVVYVPYKLLQKSIIRIVDEDYDNTNDVI